MADDKKQMSVDDKTLSKTLQPLLVLDNMEIYFVKTRLSKLKGSFKHNYKKQFFFLACCCNKFHRFFVKIERFFQTLSVTSCLDFKLGT